MAGSNHELAPQLAAVATDGLGGVTIFAGHRRHPACDAPIITHGGWAGGVMRPFGPALLDNLLITGAEPF